MYVGASFLIPAMTLKYTRNADGLFVCPHCKIVKNKQNTMYYHIKREHEEDLPFTCAKCPTETKFLQKSSYLHHLATHHPEDPHPSESEKNMYAAVEYPCSACDHISHTKANTRIHFARTHSDWVPAYSKQSPCSGCSKQFQSSSAYLYHALQCFAHRASADQLNMLSRIK
jgi:hypothetical protein